MDKAAAPMDETRAAITAQAAFDQPAPNLRATCVRSGGKNLPGGGAKLAGTRRLRPPIPLRQITSYQWLSGPDQTGPRLAPAPANSSSIGRMPVSSPSPSIVSAP